MHCANRGGQETKVSFGVHGLVFKVHSNITFVQIGNLENHYHFRLVIENLTTLYYDSIVATGTKSLTSFAEIGLNSEVSEKLSSLPKVHIMLKIS